jgi:hypothetical protein
METMRLEQVNLDSVDRMVYSQKSNVEAAIPASTEGDGADVVVGRLLIGVGTGGTLVTGRERRTGGLLC